MVVTFTSAYIDLAMELFTESFNPFLQNRLAATAKFTFKTDEQVTDIRSWLECASSVGLISSHNVEVI